MKYKVGDVVIPIEPEDKNEHPCFIEPMKKFVGKKVTIERITSSGLFYVIGGCNWREKWLKRKRKLL